MIVGIGIDLVECGRFLDWSAFKKQRIFTKKELEYADKISSIKLLNKLINNHKSDIKSLFLKTQNLIMHKCFKNEFHLVRFKWTVQRYNTNGAKKRSRHTSTSFPTII